jgi:hypothetical protein
MSLDETFQNLKESALAQTSLLQSRWNDLSGNVTGRFNHHQTPRVSAVTTAVSDTRDAVDGLLKSLEATKDTLMTERKISQGLRFRLRNVHSDFDALLAEKAELKKAQDCTIKELINHTQNKSEDVALVNERLLAELAEAKAKNARQLRKLRLQAVQLTMQSAQILKYHARTRAVIKVMKGEE